MAVGLRLGSLAHDDEFAVAAVTRAPSIRGVGIDVEPPLPLPGELLDVIATANEREQLKGDLISARLLFCMKEAVYKATYPIDGHVSGASRRRNRSDVICRVNQLRAQLRIM